MTDGGSPGLPRRPRRSFRVAMTLAAFTAALAAFVVGGIVASLKQQTTKKGEPMVFAGLEDVTGACEVVAFNSVYAHARDLAE